MDENLKTEYEIAIKLHRQNTEIRRKDLALIITVQGALLTIIGNSILKMDFSHLLLAFVGLSLLFVGLNNERRLTAYMEGYMKRAQELEQKLDMKLLKEGWDSVQSKSFLFSNTKTFPLFYFVFIIVWIGILIFNFSKFWLTN